ncbi:MAG: hypothetical protein BWX70_03334 [Verrucomicrobia bacterium ADurb.Bin070]|nr:MAG: hypothetical protein BWX70_03334 [Verrucomicrobia bacterium ADurb.Bin070]
MVPKRVAVPRRAASQKLRWKRWDWPPTTPTNSQPARAFITAAQAALLTVTICSAKQSGVSKAPLSQACE